MMLGKSVALDLSVVPALGPLPYREILQNWVRADLAPEACRRVLLDMISRGSVDPKLVEPDAITRGGGLVVVRDLIFATRTKWRFGISARDKKQRLLAEPLDARELAQTASFISWASTCTDRKALLERLARLGGDINPEDLLLEAGEAYPSWPTLREPGICRHEHASLVIQSETTRILFDPINLNRSLPNISEAPVAVEGIDAICITHGHGDHFHLPSLLSLTAARRIPVYVPSVDATSMFTPKPFGEMASAVGLDTRVVKWHTTVQVGDIEIDVLPFYGEQPSVMDVGVPAGVRNWGNSYRVNTPQFSAMVLVDSGADPLGNVADVVAQSAKRRGPPTLLLACCRSFHCPFFGGLWPYWAPIPFSSLRKLYERHQAGTLPSVTAGPAGIATACHASGARYFAPYANGFNGIGHEIKDIGWRGDVEPSEKEAVATVAAEIRRLGGNTRVQPWKPGDFLAIRDEEIAQVVAARSD